ncbi:hypothetical protein HDV06_005055 [Boothiomyces sp. JEL0866]|nr:hypothetical protein HDV06_005055 [Boothiomyces sp. JEL0866]
MLVLGALSLLPSLFAASMTTVPITQGGYYPPSQLLALYESNDDHRIETTLQIKTVYPTIYFGNFPDIKVHCGHGMISLGFDNTSSASAAFNSWSQYGNLHFLVHHEVQCLGLDKVLAFKVNSLNQTAAVLSAKSIAANISEIIQEYSFTVSNGPKTKRDNILTIPFNLNYQNGNVLDPIISLYSADGEDLACSNCFATGGINFGITASGSRLSISDYKFTVTGNLNSSLDIQGNLFAANDKYLANLNLFTYAFNPIVVNGLFSLNPVIAVDTGISYTIPKDIQVNAGYDFTYTYDLSVTAFESPIFTENPVFTPHPLNITKDVGGSISAHLIPSFKIEMNLFDIVEIGSALPLDSSLGLELDYATPNNCSPNDFSVSFLGQADLLFNIHGRSSWHLFNPFNNTYNVFNTETLVVENPVPTATQEIAKIKSIRGNQLFDCLLPDESEYLVQLPTQFINKVFVKLNGFVIIELEQNGKIDGNIVHVLFKEDIKNLKKLGLFPKEFDKQEQVEDDGLFVNNNRIVDSDEEEY